MFIDCCWILHLCSDYHHRVVGPCRLKLNRSKYVFCNLIDALWRCSVGGYTHPCICYRVRWDEWGIIRGFSANLPFIMMLPDNTKKAYRVLTGTEFNRWGWRNCGTAIQNPLSLRICCGEAYVFSWARFVIGPVVDGVTQFKYEGMDIFALHLC